MSDPRRVLADTKPYLAIPLPLLSYICSLGLVPATKHIFLFYWGKGHMAGDWKSQLETDHLVQALRVSKSSVKRAHRELIAYGLIRRIPTPYNHSQNRPGTTITEVLIPAEAEAGLLAAPNRTKSHAEKNTDSDPRRILTGTKQYLSIPLPLFFYICRLKLAPATKLVFLLLWAKGHMAGNWKSRLAVKHAADLLHLSESSVTRAHDELLSHELIQRNRTGFNMIATTEVLIPVGAKIELLSTPHTTKPHSRNGHPNRGEIFGYIKKQLTEKLSEKLSGSELDLVSGQMLWEVNRQMDAGHHYMRAVNTCLKRFRMNQWYTPCGLREFQTDGALK